MGNSYNTMDVNPFEMLNFPSVGDEVIPRTSATVGGTQTTAVARFSFFTARRTFLARSLSACTSTTAAGATPTLAKMGIFSVAANGNGTRIGVTGNDVTLFSVASTVFNRNLLAPAQIVAGQRYAFCIMLYTTAAAPTVLGSSFGQLGAQEPRLSGYLSAQADIPGSFNEADLQVTQSTLTSWGRILP